MKVLKGKGTKMMGGLAFILSCAIPWFSADAGTVAWYRFNEGTLGARVDSSIVIENSANPGQLQGRCQQQMANGTLSTTDTGYMPMSVAGFPAGNGVVDPITRSKAANDRAFRFLTSKWGDPNEGGAGHYYVSKGDGACVTVPHDDRFHLSSFTVECFFRMDPIELSEGQVNDTTEQVLVCLPTGIGNGSYSFYLWIVNKLHRIHGGMWGLNNVCSNLDYKDVDFIDGKWHHVAVTFDGASRIMRLYLDYIKVKEATNVNAALPYYDSARRIPLMIGSDGTGYGRRFCGDIDEVRISDEALAVDALLRPAAYMPEIDAPSTVCHVTFDTAASDKFGFPLWKELNALPLDGAIKAEVKWDSVKGREPELDMSSLPAVDVYNADLREKLKAMAAEEGITLREGVYMMFTGPSFETPAEIRFARTIGADAAGMSTVPETIVANYLGMEVLGLACATNMATGLAVNKHSHEEVLRIANESSGRLCDLIKHLAAAPDF